MGDHSGNVGAVRFLLSKFLVFLRFFLRAKNFFFQKKLAKRLFREREERRKEKKGTPKAKSVQHPRFPSGHPPQYSAGLTWLNFANQTGYGVFHVVWPYAQNHAPKRRKICGVFSSPPCAWPLFLFSAQNQKEERHPLCLQKRWWFQRRAHPPPQPQITPGTPEAEASSPHCEPDGVQGNGPTANPVPFWSHRDSGQVCKKKKFAKRKPWDTKVENKNKKSQNFLSLRKICFFYFCFCFFDLWLQHFGEWFF